MNLNEINGKLDRLKEIMYLSQRPIHYVDNYDRYQPEYQDATIEAIQSNQQGQGWYHSNFGDQWYDHGQMSNQNRGYTSWNNQGPSYDSYDPQEYNSYAPHSYDNYASQQQFNDFEQWEDNSDQSSQDDEMKNMMRQIMEGQAKAQQDLTQKMEKILTETMEKLEQKIDSNHGEEQAKFEDIYSHLKNLDNQIAQVASSSQRSAGSLPEKPEENPKECFQVNTLRSGKELPSGDKAVGKTKKPEEDELSVEEEANNEVLAEENGSEKNEEKQAQEAPKTEEKTEHLPPYDNEMMDSHKTHDGEASSLELKKEPHTVETERGTEEEASNGKTSMESKGEAEKQDDWSILKTPNTEMKPLPQELRALKRYKGTNLVLNWKKCHFMEREGTILGPITSKEDIEVDKVKVAGPLTHLLCKETSFKFIEACLEAFTKRNKELENESIVRALDWSYPFESGGDFTATLSEPLTA